MKIKPLPNEILNKDERKLGLDEMRRQNLLLGDDIGSAKRKAQGGRIFLEVVSLGMEMFGVCEVV